MDAISELKNLVNGFTTGAISLDEFENWLMDSLWNIEALGGNLAKAEYHRVEGVLAEASHAHWDQASLRHELELVAGKFESRPHPVSA